MEVAIETPTKAIVKNINEIVIIVNLKNVLNNDSLYKFFNIKNKYNRISEIFIISSVDS